jgi:two-component system, OmpR family, sensor histidine kinase VicK
LTLWDKALPAEHRIREIEQGVELQRIEVVYDARQALELYQSLIMSAEKEIKIMFPTTNALIRQDKEAGILFLLQEAAAVKKCQVKVLMPNDELIHKFIRDDSGTSRRFIEQEERGKATILIVDNKTSLVMELRDDRKKTFHEAIGLSTYSNSQAGSYSNNSHGYNADRTRNTLNRSICNQPNKHNTQRRLALCRAATADR